jgi:hypothetical protein
MTQDAAGHILARICGNGRGSIFTPKEFLETLAYPHKRRNKGRVALAT